MENDEISKLHTYQWMQSRIPALDALTAFVPEKLLPINSSMKQTLDQIKGESRWYPVEGGHRVLIRDFNDLTYDSALFTIEKGAWAHEHCDICDERIPQMTLCYVTGVDEPYHLLCVKCYEEKVMSIASS